MPKKTKNDSAPTTTQMSISSFMEPPPPSWTKEGLLDHIVELTVSDDQSFRLVEKGSFRRLLIYQRPQTWERDIPHHTKLREEILARALDVEGKLKTFFEVFADAVDVLDTSVDDAEEFEPGDLLGKVLAMINQIRASPQAKAFFEQICVEEQLEPLQLIKWVQT
ncbi:hypothetical protein OBBRIDRAFT_834185 [Obba rivulosa]|uniref:Uncharacterized protein n=1 Tax=Obba rivulosa TaxID=1052685 RepID=A0A8E2AUT4_9APHY|nr:hypothetical protein OBBRIDRAFT_834185 [Obba rivulosa]